MFSDFFLFPHLKSIMKDADFPDVLNVQKLVTVVPLLIPKITFARKFQKSSEHCKMRVVKNGDYFCGTKCNFFVYLFLSSVLSVFFTIIGLLRRSTLWCLTSR
ncbi:hypothetical protein NPIL_562551 [Nephila pilipes]|uniref:Uncharacterized protein n=1 Tax=Nephila pilipes TaxID=299642 RepID=A0A8X6NJA4_NEPPI|nr:hypothetical protein NPIL_562551 [Nephila pilipes]